MICYYAKCQSLRDFIDEKVAPSNFHYHRIKQYTNLLVKELESQVDALISAGDGKDSISVVEQFVNASQQADHLFEIALKLELIDKDKKIECATKVSAIFKEYGVE
jgi:hypothetical protein